MSFYLSPTSSILLKIYFPKKEGKKTTLISKKYKKTNSTNFVVGPIKMPQIHIQLITLMFFEIKTKIFFIFLFGYIQENVLNGIEL